MIERIIENWLDKASEKAFQIPFCYVLIQQGHTILHMTRHCGMEHGKDIISRDEHGTICAYQLKGAPGSKIKLRDWQQGIQGQIVQLVFTPVSHPSVAIGTMHQSYFVTNGGIEEEVGHAIVGMNQQWSTLPQPYHLKTIVDGELKEMAKKLTYAFLPADLKDFKSLLEFLLQDGKGCLNKEKLAAVIQSVLTDEVVSRPKFKERINSAAILTSIALSTYINEQNHFAVYEGWVIYLSALLGYCELHNLARTDFANEYQIGEQLAIDALEDLWDEIRDRRDFLGDSPMEDAFLHKSKRLLLIGLMSSLGIHHCLSGKDFDFNALTNFIGKNLEPIDIWGESGIPHTLSVYWYLLLVGSMDDAKAFLCDVLEIIIASSEESKGMIGPYYDADTCLDELFNHRGKITLHRNTSWYLESIIHLLVRQGEQDFLIEQWRSISYFKFLSFQLASPIDFFNWKNERGKEIWYLPKTDESWSSLAEVASEHQGDEIPQQIKVYSTAYPLFLNVMPHRVSPGHIRWFDQIITDNLKQEHPTKIK